MTSTAPWWGSGLFALATGLLTALTAALATILPTRTERRTERRRLSRELKERLYPDLIRDAYALLAAPLWETTKQTRQARLDELTSTALQVTFFAPEEISSAVTEILHAAAEFADLSDHIQASTKSGHQGAIDQRFAADHAAASQTLRTATANFVHVARRDLEIPGATFLPDVQRSTPAR
jgi:hypothetical protein